MKDLKTKRDTFKQAFNDFMNRDGYDMDHCWGPEDDQILKDIAIVYIEFLSGIHGEPVLDEIMKIAQTLGEAVWSKLGDHLDKLES